MKSDGHKFHGCDSKACNATTMQLLPFIGLAAVALIAAGPILPVAHAAASTPLPTSTSSSPTQARTPAPSRKDGTTRSTCVPMRDSAGRAARSSDPAKLLSRSGQKDGATRSTCVPHRDGVGQGEPFDVSSKPLPKAGRKSGMARGDCDPATSSRADATHALPDAPRRLVHAFPNGTKLFANERDGVNRGYSAVDRYGRALKVTLTGTSRERLVPGPEDSIARGKRRAEEARKRQEEAVNKAIEQAAAKKCIVKILEADGDIVYWDLSASGMGCPKGG